MAVIKTRMGDGGTVEMTRDDLRRDLVEGSEAAAKKGRIPPLDGAGARLPRRDVRLPEPHLGRRTRSRSDPRQGRLAEHDLLVAALERVSAPLNREQAIRLFERRFAFDTMEVGPPRLLGEAVKFIATYEAMHMDLLQHSTVLPLFYGFMPNLGPVLPAGRAVSRTRPTCCPRARSTRPARHRRRPSRRCVEDVVWLSGR